MTKNELSIIIPARNEAEALRSLLPCIRQEVPDAEIIIVDDGSTDDTPNVCREEAVRSVRHPYAKGNGAAVKSGIRAAQGEMLLFMDGDGQHAARDIPKLLARMREGYDMVVGARESRRSQAGVARWLANAFYNRFASGLVGHRIADLTSGFRVCRAKAIRQFIELLPNGFSYPTTSTMAFFRAGYSVGYVPIEVSKRGGESKSHIRMGRDGARFLLIIFRVATLYSPLKLFVPISAVFFFSGLGYYAYTFSMMGRFTNGSGLLLTASILIFLIGLVSEQITQLVYMGSRDG